MQFTHKLARRLALLRGAALVTIAAAAGACDSESRDELGPSMVQLPASRLTLADHPPRVEVREQVQLAAIGEFPSGLEAPVEVDWSATGGSIDSTGLFSAAVSGSYTIIARERKNKDLGDSTVIVVRPPRLVGVEISPASALLAPTGKQVFAATGHLRDGSQVQLAPQWSASVGSIDSAGVYEAPRAAGKYRVIATSKRGIADTAMVEVADADTGASIQKIQLTPASVSLPPKGTQAFTASARLSDNSSGPVAVTYRATGGTVTPEGLYSAGSTKGVWCLFASTRDDVEVQLA